MNILFIATVYDHLAVFHKPYINYFQEQGYTVHVAGSISMGRKDELEAIGAICHDISFDKSVLSKRNLKACKELNRLFNDIHYELIHVHTPIASFLTRFVLKNKKMQGPVVYTAHGFHFYNGAPLKNWLIYFSSEKIAAKWTDHLITINQEDYENSVRLGYSSKNVSLVHGVGVEFEKKEQHEVFDLKKFLGVPNEAILIGYVAELNENKNHQFLLNNWKRIKNEFENAYLLIIGIGGLENELKDFVNREQLRDVMFLGYRKDVPILLNQIDIVTLLSFREGLPKSIMEAMSKKIPCVVSNTRGMRDLIKNEKNGYVVEQGDNEQLYNAFKQLLTSPALRSEMGQESYTMVQPYLMGNVMQEYADIYKKLLSKTDFTTNR
ncbi:MAG: glycosyltransferase family 4 protein [Solibacillus sp.]